MQRKGLISNDLLIKILRKKKLQSWWLRIINHTKKKTN